MPSIVQNSKPVIGNGDISIWVKKSGVERANKQHQISERNQQEKLLYKLLTIKHRREHSNFQLRFYLFVLCFFVGRRKYVRFYHIHVQSIKKYMNMLCFALIVCQLLRILGNYTERSFHKLVKNWSEWDKGNWDD